MKTLISIIAVLVVVGCSNGIQIVEDANTMLQTEIEKAFSNIDIAVLQMKIVKTDRSDYEPHF